LYFFITVEANADLCTASSGAPSKRSIIREGFSMPLNFKTIWVKYDFNLENTEGASCDNCDRKNVSCSSD